MTPRERIAVVELLRCGYDMSQWLGFGFLNAALERLYGEWNNRIYHLAYAAAEALYRSETCMPFTECLLEAAQLVEEGEWP